MTESRATGTEDDVKFTTKCKTGTIDEHEHARQGNPPEAALVQRRRVNHTQILGVNHRGIAHQLEVVIILNIPGGAERKALVSVVRLQRRTGADSLVAAANNGFHFIH